MRYLTDTFWRNRPTRKTGGSQDAELTSAVRALDTRADETQSHLADIAACRSAAAIPVGFGVKTRPAWLLEIAGVPLLEESYDP